jgi:predicted O-methyltransferase YrrM
MPNRMKIIHNLVKDNLVTKLGAEIGVWMGETTEYLLNNMKELKIYAIDPYEVYEHYNKHHRGASEDTQERFDDVYNKVSSKLNNMFPERIIWIRDMGLSASYEIKDNSLDFVFIDGNHGYEYVKADIAIWKHKVRKDGYLIGHDIFSNKDSHQCVKRAVEFHFENNYSIEEGYWYIKL